MSSKGGKIQPPNPVEYANKRKAAMERAKRLKEERKLGIPDDQHTFAPQVNKRPAFLNNASGSTAKGKDALDQLADNYTPPANDIFEKPLPGKKTYDSNGPSEPLNYNNDALGMELSKLKPSSGGISSSSNGKSNNANQFKSKFNNQLEAESSRSKEPPMDHNRYGNSNTNDDGYMMNNLRSSEKTKKDLGPGWNDDYTAPTASVPQEPRRSRRPLAQAGANNINLPLTSSTPTSTSNATTFSSSAVTNRRRQVQKQDWNNDYSSEPIVQPPKQQALSPRIDPTNTMENRQEDIRSRLSLLKSKIRKSESGGGLKSYLNMESSEMDSSLPRTAPVNNDYLSQSNIGQKPLRSRSTYQQYENELPSSSTNVTQSLSSSSRPQQQIPQQQQQQRQEAYQPSFNSRQQPPPRQQQQQQQRYEPPVEDSPPPVQSQKSRMSTKPDYPSPQRVNDHNDEEEEEEDDTYDDNAEEAEYAGEKKECPDCGRKFIPSSFSKHAKICAKVFMKKRKVFDSKKMRVNDNPELVKILTQKEKAAAKQQSKAAKEQPIESKASKWKEQSKNFREAMKNARIYAKAEEEGKPLPPPMISQPDPSLILCPHCGRRFNDKAAERHIPLCSNIRAKPTSLKRSSNNTAGAKKR